MLRLTDHQRSGTLVRLRTGRDTVALANFCHCHKTTSICLRGKTSWPRRYQQALVLLVALATVTVFFYLSSHSHLSANHLASLVHTGHRQRTTSGNHGNQRLPRVLCLVLTTPRNTDKVAAVNQTWGRRCDKLLYVYGGGSSAHITGDKLHVVTREDRAHLTYKMRAALEHVYTVYNTSYDWLLKADDDTYVIMENLKALLARHDPRDSSYLGAHFKRHVKNGYMSGGAGYILSSRALRDLVEVGFKKGVCKIMISDEDVQIGQCLQLVNATVRNTSDVEGKETFHAQDLLSYLSPPHPQWLNVYMWNTPKFGPGCCGRFTATFHYVKPREMYVYEHLLYRTSVHDIGLEEYREQDNQTTITGHG